LSDLGAEPTIDLVGWRLSDIPESCRSNGSLSLGAGESPISPLGVYTRSLVYDCGTPHLFKLSVRDLRIDRCGDQSKCSYYGACRRPLLKLSCYAYLIGFLLRHAGMLAEIRIAN
jgi:hypothetical protein